MKRAKQKLAVVIINAQKTRIEQLIAENVRLERAVVRWKRLRSDALQRGRIDVKLAKDYGKEDRALLHEARMDLAALRKTQAELIQSKAQAERAQRKAAESGVKAQAEIDRLKARVAELEAALEKAKMAKFWIRKKEPVPAPARELTAETIFAPK